MITCSSIAYGDQLGAQMSTLANLMLIANKTNQEIVFYEELKNFRRGFLFLENFKGLGFIKLIQKSPRFISKLYCAQFSGISKEFAGGYKRIYKSGRIKSLMDGLYYKYVKLNYKDFAPISSLKNNVNVAPQLLELDNDKNYDITSGFGTYKAWKVVFNQITAAYEFNDDIQKEGREWFYTNITDKRSTVSVHFRKTDYLLMASLNLTDDYYAKAISKFPPDEYQLVIFSDDIDACKETIKNIAGEYCVTFVNAHKPAVDMFIMTLCENNIIANSSFSFWGGALNKKQNKTVVCPHDFIGEKDPENTYINGNWYPEEWIAL